MGCTQPGPPALSLLEVPGADHYTILTGSDPAWKAVLDAVLSARSALEREPQ